MQTVERYVLELFDQRFSLATNDGSSADLKKVAEYYKKIVMELQKNLPDRTPLDIAILAGLKISDEFHSTIKKIKKDNDVSSELDDDISKKVNNIIKQLDISLKM